MEDVDVVLVSDAKTDSLKKITERAIKSLGEISVFVVESNRNVKYTGAKMIYPSCGFSYNSYLNLGARAGIGKYIFFGNNDLVFERDSLSTLLRYAKLLGLNSVSPLCPDTHKKLIELGADGVLYGYRIGVQFCGWAFMWSRELYERLGGLDEAQTFWCSDNVVVEQLKQAREEHALITRSIVAHLGRGKNTLKTVQEETFYEYTIGDVDRFQRDNNKKLEISRPFVEKLGRQIGVLKE